MRTIEWDAATHRMRMIDQRLLPGQLVFLDYADHRAVAQAIRDMVVRGAPAIGVAGAYGFALAAQAAAPANFSAELEMAAQHLKSARPTAVNLAWAVDQCLAAAQAAGTDLPAARQAALEKAHQLAEEDVATNLRMARFGAELIQDGDTIIHHCNTGALATVDWGTALGVIRMAHEQGKRVHVLVDETRPRLQGARLTAWELEQYGIPYEIISDNAAGYFLRSGQAQKVLFGADRVAANGDVANKIGSYMLALAAHDNNIPVYSVFPRSTVDFSIATGEQIPIEERGPEEVLALQVNGEAVAPAGARARNPAFDVTPNRLLTGCITDCGVVYPPFHIHLPQMLKLD